MSEPLIPPRRAYRDYLPEGQRDDPGQAAEPAPPRPGHGTMFLRFDVRPGPALPFVVVHESPAYASWQDQDRHADLAGTPTEVMAWAFAQRAGGLLVLTGGGYQEAGICLPASVADGEAALRAIGMDPGSPVS